MTKSHNHIKLSKASRLGISRSSDVRAPSVRVRIWALHLKGARYVPEINNKLDKLINLHKPRFCVQVGSGNTLRTRPEAEPDPHYLFVITNYWLVGTHPGSSWREPWEEPAPPGRGSLAWPASPSWSESSSPSGPHPAKRVKISRREKISVKKSKYQSKRLKVRRELTSVKESKYQTK